MIDNTFSSLIYSISVATATPDGAINSGNQTRAVSSMAEQTLLLAGSGVLLGLGIGISVSGVGIYLYKRKQIREKLAS